MKAAVLRAIGAKFDVADVDVSPPREGEVLVKMAAAGVCHSDLHVVKGDLAAPLPGILGHEGAGVVLEVGPGVTNVARGDHVIPLWRASCGTCYYCSRGRPALCDMGTKIRQTGRMLDGTSRFSLNGEEIFHFNGVSSFAEMSVLPASGVIPIPKDVPLAQAALVGCGVLTGVGAVFNTARVEPGASVVVIGSGGVGLNVVQGAALAGAEKVIAVDLRDNKLELARQFGATHTINGSREDVLRAVQDLTGGRGADYAFEVIGLPQTVAQAVAIVRRGGTAVAIGIPAIKAEFALPALPMVTQEKVLKGSLYGSCDFHRDIPLILSLYTAGKLKLGELITKTYPLTEINEAFEALERGEGARGVIVFD